MKQYYINKGIDNEIEFRGLKGIYLYYAAGGIAGTVMLSLVLHVIGAPLILSLVILIGGLCSSYFVAIHYNKTHGKWGFEKLPIKNLQPKILVRTKSIRKTIKLTK